MKTFPLPAVIAALAAIATLPFSVAAAGTFLLTAGLAFIIHADYALRFRPAPLPKRQPAPSHAHFRRLSVATEQHRLAA